LRIIVGYATAILAAAITQVRFALPHAPSVTEGGEALLSWWSDFGMLALAVATHIAIFSSVFALIAITIGEWQRLRDWTYYVLSGVVIALGGFLAQYASEAAAQPTIINNYALVAFAATGLVGGLVYWLVAGHKAGANRQPARIEVADEEPVHAAAAANTAAARLPAANAGAAAKVTPPRREDTAGVAAGVPPGRPKAPAVPPAVPTTSVPEVELRRGPTRLRVAPQKRDPASDGEPSEA
jgi:hypothetical protein